MPERESLEVAKLRLEIRELERAKSKQYATLITLFASTCITVLGFYLQARQFTATFNAQEQTHREDYFDRVMGHVSDADPGQRSRAITSLSWLGPLVDPEATITVVANRFEMETDPRTMVQVMFAARRLYADTRMIDNLCKANRRLALALSRSSGTFAGLSTSGRVDSASPADTVAINQGLRIITEDLASSAYADDSKADGSRPVPFALLLKVSKLRDAYATALRRARNSRPSSNELTEATKAARVQMEQQAMQLAASSTALCRIAHALSDKFGDRLGTRDLSGIVLVAGDLDSVDMNGSRLDGALIGVSTRETNFAGCSMKSTYLVNLADAGLTRGITEASGKALRP